MKCNMLENYYYELVLFLCKGDVGARVPDLPPPTMGLKVDLHINKLNDMYSWNENQPDVF